MARGIGSPQQTLPHHRRSPPGFVVLVGRSIQLHSP